MAEYRSEEWYAALIRKYWKQRGYEVRAAPVACQMKPGSPRPKRPRKVIGTEAGEPKPESKEPSTTYLAVRSDLVNGLPQGFRRYEEAGRNEP